MDRIVLPPRYWLERLPRQDLLMLPSPQRLRLDSLRRDEQFSACFLACVKPRDLFLTIQRFRPRRRFYLFYAGKDCPAAAPTLR